MRNKNKVFTSLLLFSLVFSLVFAVFNVSLAQNTPKADTAKVLQAKVRSIQKRMQSHINRGQKTFDKLDSIIKKIENRRDKIAADGLDVSSVNALIETAKTQKFQAEASLAIVKQKYSAINTASDPKIATLEFTAAMKDLRTKLVALQSKLQEIVKAMKDLD